MKRQFFLTTADKKTFFVSKLQPDRRQNPEEISPGHSRRRTANENAAGKFNLKSPRPGKKRHQLPYSASARAKILGIKYEEESHTCHRNRPHSYIPSPTVPLHLRRINNH